MSFFAGFSDELIKLAEEDPGNWLSQDYKQLRQSSKYEKAMSESQKAAQRASLVRSMARHRAGYGGIHRRTAMKAIAEALQKLR